MKRYTKKKKGGEAIDSGGFGCVFSPALKCKNKTKRSNGISKLSLKQMSDDEWKILSDVNKLLSKIPNYKNYFLLDNITTCLPGKLTSKDKVNFEKCFSLQDVGINETNVNKHLNKLRIINMPYGGINLDKVIDQYIINFNTFNKLLFNLLDKAIIPMNKLNIYHFDIKSSNILFKNSTIKLIDFGEIGISTSKKVIPDILYDRALQFNSPFSRILFSNHIDTLISKLFIRFKVNKNTPIEKIVIIFKEIYIEFKQMYGVGHEIFLGDYLLPTIFKLISPAILKKIYNVKHRNLDSKSIIIEWIANYCSTVIKHYFDFKKMRLDREKYFKEVYSKNVDIYGLLSCYIQYIMSENQNYSKTFKLEITNIIIKYCFNDKYAAQPLPVDEIKNQLNSIKLK
mgnify:CR=1 FL=1